MSARTTVVVSSHWGEPQSEMAFLSRSLAGAATRFSPVAVLVPGMSFGTSPDGAFDVEGIGAGPFRWPEHLSRGCVAVVDDLTQDVATLLAGASAREVFSLNDHHPPHLAAGRLLRLVGPGEQRIVQLYVPVNRLAERHRHNGFGFTGYELVLSGNGSRGEVPPPEAAWITAAFPDRHVIVVENGLASAWKGRALRGCVGVDTRMDLWRLMAHANVCIDLSPGTHFGRECIEAMRFGTPILVPRGSGAAEAHATLGGSSAFADPHELLVAVARLHDHATRQEASTRARGYADATYGSPESFVSSLEAVIKTA